MLKKTGSAKQTLNGNDELLLPMAKDFAQPTNLSKDEKAALTAFQAAMQALKEEERKYGKKSYL
jgi:hypothetical protein